MGKKNIKNRFETLCRRIFKFLETDFGFKIADIKHYIYGDYITYKNKTTVVKIQYVERDQGVIYILIVRLVNGEIPSEPILIKSESILHSFDLEDLIALRSASFKIKRPLIEKLFDPINHERILNQFAFALKRYAQDVLRGDFSIFAELEKIVRKRATDMQAREPCP